MKRRTVASFSFLFLILTLATPWAAWPLEAGPKTPVFATTGDGTSPAVASGVDGGYAVLWARGNGTLAVRAFTPSGTPAGPEHTLFVPFEERESFSRTYTQLWDLAALPEGGYVAVWQEVSIRSGTYSNWFVLQRLTPSGEAVGLREFLDLSSWEPSLSVTVDRSGLLTLLWSGRSSVGAQRFDLQGAAQSPSMLLALGAPDSWRDGEPFSAAHLPGGGFAVAQVLEEVARPRDVLLQIFRPDGTAAGPAVPVHAERTAERDNLIVAAGPSGHIVVAWRDVTARQLLARRAGPDGQPLGPEIVVSTAPEAARHALLDVVVRPGGSFLIQWLRDSDLLAAAFGPDGSRTGPAPEIVLDRGENFGVRGVATPGGWISTWAIHRQGISGLGPWFSALTLPCGSGLGGAPSLCLNGDRFRAEVTWRVPSTGASGAGQPIALTGDTGAFWFFDPANYELNVKVLDGRGVNGHFWVFYSSLTDVEFELTVTDTVTGQKRMYKNPAGTMASRADTAAF